MIDLAYVIPYTYADELENPGSSASAVVADLTDAKETISEDFLDQIFDDKSKLTRAEYI